MASEPVSFEGVVLRRDPDGYGFVQFSNPPSLRDQTGVFSREVFVDPMVREQCTQRTKVKGTVRPFRDGFKVVRLLPFNK